jgi:hypothetical protein
LSAGPGDRIAESVVALFGVAVARVRLLELDGMLRVIGWAGRSPDDVQAGDPIKPGVGISGRAFVEGRAVWASDIFSDPRFLVDEAVAQRLADTPAVLGVPPRVRGEVIGSLTVTDRPGRVFSEADGALLRLFADHAAVAIRSASLFARAETARSEAETAAEALRASEARYRRAEAEAQSRYLGLRYRKPHALRHTFASLLLESRGSPAYVKEQMGHSSIMISVGACGHLVPRRQRGRRGQAGRRDRPQPLRMQGGAGHSKPPAEESLNG